MLIALVLSGCNSLALLEPATAQQAGGCQFVTGPSAGPAGSTPIHAETFVNGLEVPWGMAFLPGGEILVTERPGRLRLIQNGNFVAEPLATIPVSTGTQEGGLLGIAVDPQFAQNRMIYLFETVDASGGMVNRVVRYVLSQDHRTATEDRVILDGISAGAIHDGGRLHFGPDGFLYVSTGDDRQPPNSRDGSSLNGKILRITRDGQAAAGNPEAGKPWFIRGVRNSEAFDWLDSSTLVIADNGPTGEYLGRTGGDEVDVAGAGADLGWPDYWHCDTGQGITPPILTWQNAVPPGGAAIVHGGEIPGWEGSVVIGTLGSEHLHRVVLNGSRGVASHEVYFQGTYGRLRDVEQAPTGELYVTTSNCDGRGNCPSEQDSILRIRAGS